MSAGTANNANQNRGCDKQRKLSKACVKLTKSTHAVSLQLEAAWGRNPKIIKAASQDEQSRSIPLWKTVTPIQDIVYSPRRSVALTHFTGLLTKTQWLRLNWLERSSWVLGRGVMPVLSAHVDHVVHAHDNVDQCSTSATQVTHVIFDVDGTLLDTGPLYNKAITKVRIQFINKSLFG